jgi:hypothetical protein
MTEPVILVTLFNRPDYTRRCLSALSAAYNSHLVPVMLSCDGPRGDADRPGCEEVASLAYNWYQSRKSAFPEGKTSLVISPGNMGVDEHKLQTIPIAMEWAKADAYLHLEDDVIYAKDAINCLCTLLARAEAMDDPEMISVAAYNRQDSKKQFDSILAEFGPHGTILTQGFTSWGSGMLRSTWENLFADGAQHYREDAVRSGACPEGTVNGWFDSYVATPRVKDGKVKLLKPLIARAQQIGAEGGVHAQGVSYHYQYDYNEWGAWNLPELPDTGLFGWGTKSSP